MFLPTTKQEAKELGWDALDVILVTGDAYVDSPFNGTAVIGNYLAHKGFRVGVISQPEVKSSLDIKALGEPLLFWGVSAGSNDSMVANYTATKKFRKQDDLTPGGVNTKRPDRATIAYTNLIKNNFKKTKPIILGGVEASLRRIAHYDYWDDKIRRSVLFDSKADAITYGMSEKSILEIANKLKSLSLRSSPADQPIASPGVIPAKAGIQAFQRTGFPITTSGMTNILVTTNPQDGDSSKKSPFEDIRGVCYISSSPREGYIELPSFEEVSADKDAFIKMFKIFYENNDPLTAKGLYQKHGDRYLIQNPPQPALTTEELDEVYELDYKRAAPPSIAKLGKLRALDTITFAVTTHRGCYGECNFCAIGVHQGRTIISRSERSIIKEVESLKKLPGFTGFIADVGGPTANMYGIECERKIKSGVCKDKRCLFPKICRSLAIDHSRQVELLKKLRAIPGIKKVFVGSGIRYDMVAADEKNGQKYLDEIVAHHVSGQMKVAPEHADERVLALMGKPANESLKKFVGRFNAANKRFGKNQFLTYYFIAAHPGCSLSDMARLRNFVTKELKLRPEQVQVFTPAPSCWSSVMYWTGKDPFTGKPLFVEKDNRRKDQQKDAVKGRAYTR